jgi:serine/threonine protein kinase
MASIDIALRINNTTTTTTQNTNDTNKKTNDNDDDYPIDENFEYRGYHKFGRILGRGSFGTVIECVRKMDTRAIALKLVKSKAIYKWVAESTVPLVSKDETIKKQQQQQDCLIPIEVACLLRASKINGIAKLIEYWPSIDKLPLSSNEIIKNEKDDNPTVDSIIGIVLERNYNEECLFDYLIEKGSISEIEARILIKQVVEINLSLLSIGVLHGDLKSENMLIDRRTKRIKVIDFGSAELLDLKCCSNKAVKTFRGTNLYKPPEYLLHHCFYPRPSTVWTIGIILYNMLTGDFPFQTENEVLEHKTKDILFTNKTANLSNNLTDLIKKCLAFYAADRIVIEKVLTHQWLNIVTI